MIHKKIVTVLFAVSFVSMQFMASENNDELNVRAENISSTVLEALVNQSIVNALAVYNQSKTLVVGGLMRSSADNTKLEDLVDKARARGLFGRGGTWGEPLSSTPHVGCLFARSKTTSSGDKPQIVRLNDDVLHPTIIAPQPQDDSVGLNSDKIYPDSGLRDTWNGRHRNADSWYHDSDNNIK